jgi:hypothetical protein
MWVAKGGRTMLIKDATLPYWQLEGWVVDANADGLPDTSGGGGAPFPTHIAIPAGVPPLTEVTWPVAITTVNVVRSTGVQNSALTYRVPMAAGAWKVGVHLLNQTDDGGQVTVLVDGAPIGVVETFNDPSLSTPKVGYLTCNVTADGNHDITLTVLTTDPGSGSFRVNLSGVYLTRTGA